MRHIALPTQPVTHQRTASGGRSAARSQSWSRVGLWSVLWLAHAPSWLGALWIVLGDADPLHVLRLLILTLSQVFFVLKACDAPWLRLSPRRGAWLAAVTIVVMLHSDVLRRYFSAQTGAASDYAALITSSGVVGVLALLRRNVVQNRLSPARRHGDATQPHQAARFPAMAEVWPLHLTLLVRTCRLDRAPPAVCPAAC